MIGKGLDVLMGGRVLAFPAGLFGSRRDRGGVVEYAGFRGYGAFL